METMSDLSALTSESFLAITALEMVRLKPGKSILLKITLILREILPFLFSFDLLFHTSTDFLGSSM